MPGTLRARRQFELRLGVLIPADARHGHSEVSMKDRVARLGSKSPLIMRDGIREPPFPTENIRQIDARPDKLRIDAKRLFKLRYRLG